ncbi:ABC transporter permease [Acuticoccus sp. M5D2P5]|uniref:ABC transporter permease n=1 Tax=Acuticoccus kalidii TaxID=2910977 RepID=UPI001F450DDD|nr:ABC transporter permease [Acuticoccus kalidii]MCF3936653.1 ABC transporter permease [Acuticoccus kalidii]
MGTIGRSIGSQARIFYTIASRDMQLKHRESPIGVLSGVLEPLCQILLMTLVFSTVRLRTADMGDFVLLFLMTGILPLACFRGTVTGSQMAFNKMRKALAFPQLRPLDLMFGGAFAHTAIIITLFVLITLFFKVVYQTTTPQNLTFALIPLVCNMIIGVGICSVNMTIKTWFPFWGTIFTIVTAPLSILSGMFYTADTLPTQIQRVLWWNPFFHSTELCRTFYFQEYTSTFFSPYYYSAWVIGSLAIGMLCERTFRYRLLSSKR